ncbi:MAG: polysaccharide pyruvyl transferase family protein [Planctomycetales bacterium]|nr:polysaccharide pyruvyl transferase family protein [Planctomycetales bacterium]
MHDLPVNRRQVLALAALAATAQPAYARRSARPRILLRSSWQTVNIGDVAHTPGVLHLLERHVPEAEVWLWPSSVGNGVEQLLRNRFPQLQIVQSEKEIERAFAECDFLVHGSGPSLVAQRDVERWVNAVGKPYGVYGITFSHRYYALTPLPPETIAATVKVLNGARFVFFRDSPSLELAKSHGCEAPYTDFAPDGAFATDLVDDAGARRNLKLYDLTPQKFLCCIPRYRYTPYWTIEGRNAPYDARRDRINQERVDADHAPLREAIERIVRETGYSVLLCPEDQTQMALGKTAVLDRLSPDVRNRVAWKSEFWLTGEARSTYLLSAGLFGLEMHSPIMCIGAGVPALVGRWEAQTSKGLMWKDIGLEEWLFDMDRPEDVAKFVPTVMSLVSDRPAALAKAERARDWVAKRQGETMATLRAELGLS